MEFKIISKTQMSKALTHKYTPSLEEKLTRDFGCIVPALDDGALSMITARSAKEASANQGLFKANAYALINAVYGNADSLSERARDFDLSYIPKVGPQGYSFPASYLADKVIGVYYKGYSQYLPDDMSEHDKAFFEHRLHEAAEYVKKDLRDRLCPDGKPLKPLSHVDAVMHVTSKDTAAWPLGGAKNDPHVVQYLLDHPDEQGGTVLLGQRFQRNKTFQDGSPKPRAVFNSDVRDVVSDARFTVPLTRAMQEDARRDYMSPFADLLGPDAVGAAQAKWYDSADDNKPMPYWALMGDVTGMDSCVTAEHGKAFIWLVRDCFEPEYHAALELSVMHCFTDDLVIDEKHQIHGKSHSIFSGVDWTHIIEEVLSYLINLLFLGTCYIRVPSFKDGKRVGATLYSPDKWKPALIQVCGDDSHILIACPDTSEWVFEGPAKTAQEHWAICAGIVGMEAAPDKQDLWRTRTSFCSKMYSPRVRIDYDGVKAFKPVYSPVLAANGILFPENELTNPTLTNQLSKACQILDQSYGSEKYAATVTMLVNSIDSDDKTKILELLRTDLTILDSSHAGRYGGYYACGAPDWFAANSPTVGLVLTLLGLSVEKTVEWRETLTHVHQMRRLHWMYRINPERVINPLVGDESALRYMMFFSEDIDPSNSGDVIHALGERRTVSPDGVTVPTRSLDQYSPNVTWDQNWVCDTPITTYAKTHKTIGNANKVTSQLSETSKPRSRF